MWLPGKACKYLGISNVLALTTLLNLRTTRIDWAIDGCPFGVEDIRQTWLGGQVNSKVPRSSWDYLENEQGKTFYIGSKKSDRRLVCYDMRGFTRLELRTKGEKSQAVLEALYACGSESEMIETMMGFITGYVDFVDRSQTDTNVSRLPRLDWWESFVGGVHKIRFAVRAIAQTVQGFMENVVNRYTTSVYTFAEIFKKQTGGGLNDALHELYRIGRSRAKKRHEALIAMQKSLSQPGWEVPF